MDIQLTDELEEMVLELEDAREAKKMAADREKVARDALMAELQRHEEQREDWDDAPVRGMTASGSGVYIQIQNRKKVNSKKLEALYPDVYGEVTEDTVVQVLKLV